MQISNVKCPFIPIKVHISQLAKDRVENVNDIVSVGDEIFVKVTTD